MQYEHDDLLEMDDQGRPSTSTLEPGFGEVTSPSTGNNGEWLALPRILYGFAIYPFSPLFNDGYQETDADDDEDDDGADGRPSRYERRSRSVENPYQVPLEIGSELYIFEVFRPTSTTNLSDEGALWYRGYVVASRQSQHEQQPSVTASPRLSHSTELLNPSVVAEPLVTVGIFPASHCLIKERLEDGDARLESVRRSTSADRRRRSSSSSSASSSTSHQVNGSSTTLAKAVSREPLAPLMEEDDEGDDIFGSLMSTPSRARNRASMSDARLSIAKSPTSNGKASSGAGIDNGGLNWGTPRRHDRTGQQHHLSSSASSSATTRNPRDSSQPYGDAPGQGDLDDRPAPPLPSLKAGDETAAGVEEPLIDEIACAIRESSALLYTYLSQQDYAKFRTVKAHIEALHLGRRQLLAKTLSTDELRKLRRSLVERLTLSSVQQGLDIIVRHPNSGGIADVEAHGEIDEKNWISGVRMYRMGVELAQWESDVSTSTSPYAGASAKGTVASSTSFSSGLAGTAASSAAATGQSSLGPSDLTSPKGRDALSESDPPDAEQLERSAHAQYFHLFMDMKAFFASPCRPGETAELIFSLYNRSEGRFVTEECCMLVNHQGVPLDGRLDRAKTLFRDLSQQDILDSLVLVCRIVINGHFRNPAGPGGSSSNGRAASGVYGTTALSSTPSFMSPHLSSTSLSSHQGTHDALPSAHDGSMVGLVPATNARTCRRPFACAVADVSHIFMLGGHSTTTVAASSEITMSIFAPVNESSFSTLHEDIIASRTSDFVKPHNAEHIVVGIRMFHEEYKTVIRENPTLMQGSSVTSRLGFGDVVFPDDQRNDLYLKLWSGEFPSLAAGGSKLTKSVVNVEVEAEIRLDTGAVLPNAICRGAGQANVTRYTSLLFRNTVTPTWGELLKVNIPPEQIPKCHIFFSFYNRRADKQQGSGSLGASASTANTASRPFAFAFLPLYSSDTTFLADGGHSLTLYRSEASAVPVSVYLQAKAGAPDRIPTALSKVLLPTRDTVSVRSFLCSTKLTQDPTLIRLLNWERTLINDPAGLDETLSKLRYSPEFECVKMITQIFDALFGLLSSSRNDGGEIDDEVFNAIVNLLGLVNDRRFSNFKPVLDVYIEKYFSASSAFTHLIRSMHRLVIDFAKPESAQNLRSAVKVWGHLFKLIVRSRQIQRRKEENMDLTSNHLENAFKTDLRNLMQSIYTLMSATHPPSIIGTQALAAQHFASIVPDLAECFTPEEITDIVISFCDSIAAERGPAATQKIILQATLCNGPLMKSEISRAILVPNFCRWLKPNLTKYEAAVLPLNSPTLSSKEATGNSLANWLESVRLSVAVLAALLDKLHMAVVSPGLKESRHLAAQEQDSIEFVLALLPRLCDVYASLCNENVANEALQRSQASSSALSTTQANTTHLVFPVAHPCPLFTPARLHGPDAPSSRSPLQAIKGEIAAVASVLVHVAEPATLVNFLQSTLDVEGHHACSRTMSSIMRTFRSFVRHEAFPATWLNISMLAHKSAMRVLVPASDLLVKKFVPDRRMASTFDSSLWRIFFELLLTLSASQSLLIEDFSPARQRAVWRLAGDLRGQAAKIWLPTWEALSWAGDVEPDKSSRYGGYQVNLTNLVEPVLELCLSHHDELRSTAVRVLYSLILSEFQLNDSFQNIENEILDRLDKLFSYRKGDEISRAFFVNQLRALFNTTTMDERLAAEVEGLLESIDHFLHLLLDIRNLPETEEWQDDRVIGSLRLMAFIEKRHRPIFIRYVHRLVDYHVASKQFTEAGLTLRLHADLYAFDTSRVVPAMDELGLPEQTEFARKELLYLRILEYLSKGKAYESAIVVSKALQVEYEQQLFAYKRLSELLTHQADLYASIVTQTRHHAQYFRVAFLGSGFPASVQNKQFVYRAFEWEKLGSFCERMQTKHPNASIVRGNLDVTTPELQNLTGQTLLVTPVDTQPDRSLSVFTNPEVPPAVRAYYEHNEIRTFAFTRTIERFDYALAAGAGEVANWTERVFLVCAESFPTILKRSEIVEITSVEVSPIERALEEVRSRNTDLDLLYRRYISAQQETMTKDGTAFSRLNTTPLSMALNEAVDAGPSGGVALYKRAFFDPKYIAAHPDTLHHVEGLRSSIDEQVRTIAKCLKLHQRLCPPDMVTFDKTLVQLFERNFPEEIARMGAVLEYRSSPQSPRLPSLSNGKLSTSPSLVNGLFAPSSPPTTTAAASIPASPSRGYVHTRKGSTATIRSPDLDHLPVILEPVSVNGNGSFSPSTTSTNAAHHVGSPRSMLGRTSSTRSSGPLDPASSSLGSSSQGYRLQAGGANASGVVHFAPGTSGDPTGRLSPVPSTAASTNNGTLSSERPASLLGRLASLRRKK